MEVAWLDAGGSGGPASETTAGGIRGIKCSRATQHDAALTGEGPGAAEWIRATDWRTNPGALAVQGEITILIGHLAERRPVAKSKPLIGFRD
jgi:hypothetical protein